LVNRPGNPPPRADARSKGERRRLGHPTPFALASRVGLAQGWQIRLAVPSPLAPGLNEDTAWQRFVNPSQPATARPVAKPATRSRASTASVVHLHRSIERLADALWHSSRCACVVSSMVTFFSFNVVSMRLLISRR